MRRSLPVRLSFLVCAASSVLSGCNSNHIVSGSPTGPSSPSTGSGNSTSAYVYVTSQPDANSSTDEVVAYAADANGKLTPVSGSPFSQNVGSVTASGGYLVAASSSDPNINSYKIGSDGTITLASQFNYQQQTGYQAATCGSASGFVFDPSGQSMYASIYNIDCSNNNAIASFTFSPSSGSLSYLGNYNIGYDSSANISFLGDGGFAYSANFDECMYGGLWAFQRAANGLLNGVASSITPQYGPPAPPGATASGVSQPIFRPGYTAADNANHVAVAEYPCFQVNGAVDTQIQLATYTADASGALTTSDTYATMPATAVTTPEDMEISPTGALLAVGGVGGLQIFHFNGASPITSFTSVLTTDTISQIRWDNSNHLYALSPYSFVAGSPYGSGKLHVYTLTSSGATEAPGSPYTIAEPLSLAVQAE